MRRHLWTILKSKIINGNTQAVQSSKVNTLTNEKVRIMKVWAATIRIKKWNSCRFGLKQRDILLLFLEWTWNKCLLLSICAFVGALADGQVLLTERSCDTRETEIFRDRILQHDCELIIIIIIELLSILIWYNTGCASKNGKQKMNVKSYIWKQASQFVIIFVKRSLWFNLKPNLAFKTQN